MLRSLLSGVAYIPLITATAALADTLGAVPLSSPPTLQQSFDQASEAEQKRDCGTALPLFDKLVDDPRVKAGSLASATIAVRRGHCLLVSGNVTDGEASIEQGLPIMQKAGPDFAADVGLAHQELGDIAFLRSDHDAAVKHYQAWLALLPKDDRTYPLLRLAMTTAFDGGSQPLGYADEALRIALANPKPNRKSLANIHDVHGRILLNQGQVKLAYAELKQALDFSGGLTNKVSHEDVQLRGDLAQAALLAGDRDSAREYLSFTGAGRIAESPFAVAVAMEAPDCGTETGLTPDDAAIVEFSIASDGSVEGAQTVYSRGNFAVAAAFAKAVDRWFWRPEDISKLPAFFRTQTRVEMRCSNRGGNVPSIETPLVNRFLRWAASVVPQPRLQIPFNRDDLDSLKSSGETAAAAGNNKTAAAALGAWAILDPQPGKADMDGFDRAIALGTQAAIPTESINALRVLRISRELEEKSAKSKNRSHHASLADQTSFSTLANDPAIAADPLAVDTISLMEIPAPPGNAERDAAITLAQTVADDARLPDRFPLRQAALLWLANESAQAGKLAQAQAYFQRTGLNEEQCALIGPEPAMRSSGASSSDYPMEAFRMGFEGWVKLEFNINANGTAADTRPLISYPPFVFENAATGMAKAFRYQSSYRPSGGQACVAQSTNIKFVIPTNH